MHACVCYGHVSWWHENINQAHTWSISHRMGCTTSDFIKAIPLCFFFFLLPANNKTEEEEQVFNTTLSYFVFLFLLLTRVVCFLKDQSGSVCSSTAFGCQCRSGHGRTEEASAVDEREDWFQTESADMRCPGHSAHQTKRENNGVHIKKNIFKGFYKKFLLWLQPEQLHYSNCTERCKG